MPFLHSFVFLFWALVLGGKSLIKLVDNTRIRLHLLDDIMYISIPAARRSLLDASAILSARVDTASDGSSLCSTTDSISSCVSAAKLHIQKRATQVFSTENPAAMIVLGIAILLLVVALSVGIYKKSKALRWCFKKRCSSSSPSSPVVAVEEKERPGLRVQTGGNGSASSSPDLEARVVEVEPATPSLLMGDRTPTSFMDGKDEKKVMDVLEKEVVPVDILAVCSVIASCVLARALYGVPVEADLFLDIRTRPHCKRARRAL